MPNLKELQEIIGYTFKDEKLLENALIHTSYAHEHRLGSLGSNERLEFLGDTVMNMASCQDMARLVERIYDYPMILRYTSCKQKNTRHGNLTNGNRLLGSVKGMEGMKTGYTNAAGHCLAFSCSRNGRRLIGVVTGFSKRQNCFDFTAKLLNWGFSR